MESKPSEPQHFVLTAQPVGGRSADQKLLLVQIILALSLVFVFGYFGVDKFRSPLLWTQFLPVWMDGFLGLSKVLWMYVFGSIEVILAILLIVPQKSIRRIGCALVILHLLAVLWQLGWNDVAVRDMGLLLSAMALMVCM